MRARVVATITLLAATAPAAASTDCDQATPEFVCDLGMELGGYVHRHPGDAFALDSTLRMPSRVIALGPALRLVEAVATQRQLGPYLGIELPLEYATWSAPNINFHAEVHALAGVRIRARHLSFAGEAAVGFRYEKYCLYDVCPKGTPEPDATRFELEGRVSATWSLDGFWTASVSLGTSLLERDDYTAAVWFGFQ